MNRAMTLLWAVLLVAVAIFLTVAVFGYRADQVGAASPPGSNPMGLVGAYAAHFLVRSWGVVALLAPILALGWAVVLWRDRDLDGVGRRLTGSALLVPAMCGLVHLIPDEAATWLLLRWDQSQFHGLGGALGNVLVGPDGVMRQLFDVAGSILVLSLVAALALVLMDLGLRRYVRYLWRSARHHAPAPAEASEVPERLSTEPFIAPRPAPAKQRATTSINELAKRLSDDSTLPPDADELVQRIRRHRENLGRGEGSGSSASIPAVTASEPAASTSPLMTAPAPMPGPAVSEPPPVAAAPPPPRPAPPRRDPVTAGGEYILPPVDLLHARKERRDAEHEHEKHATGKAIEDTFHHFNINVQVVAAARGPVVTQYELKLLDQGMRVGKVEGFEKDLAMKLGTEGIRIVAPLPNKTTVGVEVPNKVKEAVTMRDLVEEIDPATMALPIVIGRDAVGRPLVSDLAKMPHLLVAGATGMGKSVCMNAMICSILLFRRPEEVKFIMVDPKMVELAGYEGIPHLLCAPITDMTKAHAALEWACRTMDERYEALKATGVRDIKTYNDLGEDEVRARLERKSLSLDDLPNAKAHMDYIVVLVDEYADLMMVNKEVEKSIVRLAAKSRACGIHVILTTQRPSADVVTGLIKSNLPSRICFRVVDKNNSRVVLDVSGAENLLGKGDLLFLQPGTSLPVRGQGVWLKDQEIEAIVEHAKAQGRPEYDDEILNVGAIAMSGGGGAAGGSAPAGGEWITDRQFHGAVQAMFRYDKTGADFFRRKCGIGYNKATQYVEQLEDLGFVGPQKGTTSREILKPWDQWIDLLKDNGHTWPEDDDTYHDPFQGPGV